MSEQYPWDDYLQKVSDYITKRYFSSLTTAQQNNGAQYSLSAQDILDEVNKAASLALDTFRDDINPSHDGLPRDIQGIQSNRWTLLDY